VGDRFEYTDARLTDLIKRLGDFIKRLGNPSALLVLTYPWLFKVIDTVVISTKQPLEASIILKR